MLYPAFPWESKIKVTGWIQNEQNDELIDSCSDVSSMLDVDDPFVSRTDVLILLYRYWMAKEYFDSAFEYLRTALRVPVVTLEVHTFVTNALLYINGSFSLRL